eukprot:gene7274-7849_t
MIRLCSRRLPFLQHSSTRTRAAFSSGIGGEVCVQEENLIKTHVPLYNHSEVETKWQKFWEDSNLFVARRNPDRPKKYVLDMFPYPSGSGLHVGHVKGYAATDVMSRYYRMKGYDVLHPIGWDAFGLPAEQHAIKTGTHPSETIRDNVSTFKRQLKSLGLSYDWSRELSTTDEDYVRWTQWIFLQLFKRGLAIQEEALVNWCQGLGTVLSNEEVIDGLSERGSFPVTRLPLRQWSLTISAYGDRLLKDLDDVSWPVGTVQEQRKWIKRSEGVKIRFAVESGSDVIEVFTTRPETVMGVTFVVLAPEHKLVEQLTSSEQREAVSAYQRHVACKKDLERVADVNCCGTSGVFLGCHVIHPLTSERLPVWISDYVLGGVGSGAVMGVPAHSRPDFNLAQQFSLPVKVVIAPPRQQSNEVSLPYVSEEGEMVDSGDVSGLSCLIARQRMTSTLIERGVGTAHTSFFSGREWTFSRQRYWGEPIPIYFPVEVLDNDAGLKSPLEDAPHRIRYDQPIAVDESQLPLRLPHMNDFQPPVSGADPEGCLGRVLTWKYFERDGRWFARETNTMPQWAGSCWYYLRFADPQNHKHLISPQADTDWLPVDLYVGGQEHAVLHLLYARFWHKLLYDVGVVKDKEPFQRLVHQGMILGADREKMSKSRGNVVSIDDFVREHGADVLRMYEMFVCPLQDKHVWSPSDLVGITRFRNRVYYLLKREFSTLPLDSDVTLPLDDEQVQLRRAVHRAIEQISSDVDKLSFNDLLQKFNLLVDQLYRYKRPLPKRAYETLLILLAPFAPHLSEECWQLLGNTSSICEQSWPSFNPDYCHDPSQALSITINGVKKGTVTLSRPMDEASVLALARSIEEVQSELAGKTVKKYVYKPGKLLNFVIAKEKSK